MNNTESEWKHISLYSLTVSQVLFTATTAWDFFLSVIVIESYRYALFASLPSALAATIVVPWLIGIFFLLAVVVVFAVKGNHSLVPYPIEYGYGLIAAIYFLLILVTIVMTSSWPLMLNYIVNFVWAASIVKERRRMVYLIEKELDS